VLQQLTKRFLEAALEAEMDEHLGYDKHDAVGRNGGNSRNGRRGKTLLTEVGPVDVSVPRDRDGTFAPAIVPNRSRRLGGVEDLVVSLSAKGLTHGEICAHLHEVYGAEVSKDRITTITDRVMDGMSEWQSRPLDSRLPAGVRLPGNFHSDRDADVRVRGDRARQPPDPGPGCHRAPDLCRAKTSLGVVSWPFTEVRLPCGIR
jgi:hypothetical protein